jgi:hypothetical protein
MGHTNQTTNLHLPQFVGSDKPTWLSDVNGAMLTIDNAYGQIEADASAAATAASGAVTTATGAASTASSAASTASTAASNASTALTTANNAAGTANNAYNEAHEALGRLNGEVLATVTADGVKTYKELIGEIITAETFAQITRTSQLTETTTGGVEYFSIENKTDASVWFTGTRLSGTGDLFVACHRGGPNAANNKYMILNGTTPSDQSNVAPASGTVLTLYK